MVLISTITGLLVISRISVIITLIYVYLPYIVSNTEKLLILCYILAKYFAYFSSAPQFGKLTF